MAYIVGDPCVKCKYTDCVAVCPVECFYEGVNSLVINPDECIDCGACEPECPTTAIFEEGALPEKWQVYVGINSVLSGAQTPDEVETDGWPQHLVDAIKSPDFEVWPQIDQTKDPMAGADEAASEEDKLSAFDPKGGEA